MALGRTVWTPTPEAFDTLLFSLDPDRDHAGRIYENIRRKLLEFFEARGSFVPEEHADETFDRVMRRMAEGEKVDNPVSYCYGVARFVWIEASRGRANEPVVLDENTTMLVTDIETKDLASERERVERSLECLETCLRQLADETREFIIEYYKDEKGAKIERRKRLADRLDTTLNALRLRASRLRRELAKCTDLCLARAE